MSLPPNRELLKEHPNRIYIETGIWIGDSIYQALQAGFEKIIGIELFYQQIEQVYQRFPAKKYPGRINLVHGDSAVCLGEVMRDIKEPATIFLDSHSQLLENEPESANPFPLLLELYHISQHPVKNHTIIIDDVLYLTHPEITNWTKKDIEEAIYKINPNYNIQYLANPVINNLIVAILK